MISYDVTIVDNLHFLRVLFEGQKGALELHLKKE